MEETTLLPASLPQKCYSKKAMCVPSFFQNRRRILPCRPASSLRLKASISRSCLLSLGFQTAVSPLESVCAALPTKMITTNLMWCPLLPKTQDIRFMRRSLDQQRMLIESRLFAHLPLPPLPLPKTGGRKHMTCGWAVLKRSWNRKYVGGEMRSSFQIAAVTVVWFP